MNDKGRANAIATLLGFCIDKAINYNCVQTMWHAARSVVVNKFNKHNYTFQWSYAELDAARNLFPWAVEQILDAYTGISSIAAPASGFFRSRGTSQIDRLSLTCDTAQELPDLKSESIRHICVDPPYYDNVQYAECSDFFMFG